MPSGFWEVTVGNVISFGSVVVAFLAYWRDQTKQEREREIVRANIAHEQAMMHQENQRRLEAVLKFQVSQEEINKKRDEQVSLLRIEAAQLTQIARAQDRRLQMIEDGNRDNQRRDRRESDRGRDRD
jgi:hypothetical protein